MRIAVLSDGIFPYVMGGMQRHTYYLVKYLCRKGIHVTLYHFNSSDFDIHELHLFDENEKRYLKSIVIPFIDNGKLPGHYIKASYQYSERIYQHIQSELSQYNFIYTKGFAGWKLIEQKHKNRIKCAPIGIKFHGYEMFQKQAAWRSELEALLLRKPVKKLTLQADYVFSYGLKISDIISQLGVPEHKIIELTAGIETNWLRETKASVHKKTIFAYLGRYERRKGIEELYYAIQKLSGDKDKFEFHFIGPFDNQPKLNLENVFYHGAIRENQKLQNLLDECDFLVAPSWSEGMPNVILEAMSRACAIISTDTGATAAMCGSDNGFLIEAGNKDELVKTLQNAIHLDKQELLRLKQNSVSKVGKNFLYENIIEQLINRINKINKDEKTF